VGKTSKDRSTVRRASIGSEMFIYDNFPVDTMSSYAM